MNRRVMVSAVVVITLASATAATLSSRAQARARAQVKPPLVTLRPLPKPSTPLPQLPYAPSDPHPIDTSAITPEMRETATKELFAKYPMFAPFDVTSAWQITPNLVVATGATQLGRPGLITVDLGSGAATFYELIVNRGAGPASIVGVKGDLLLLAQGRGYQVFNLKTGGVARSDENADPTKDTVIR